MSYTVGETKITADGADRIALCTRDLDANGGKAIALLYGPDRLANAHLFQDAPDLLDALKMAQFWLDIDGRYDMQGINAAIAKATQS